MTDGFDDHPSNRPRRKSLDSDSESQPLLSSDHSCTSLYDPTTTGVFRYDSESEWDNEANKQDVQSKKETNSLGAFRSISLQHKKPDVPVFNRKAFSYTPAPRYAEFWRSEPVTTCFSPPVISQSMHKVATQSSIVTIFSIWNTMMGTSLLAMPWGVGRAGILMSVFLFFMMGMICLYTAQKMIQVQKSTHVGEMAELCRVLLGRPGEIIAKVSSIIVLLGANIIYYVLMSNFLYYSVTFIYHFGDGIIVSPNSTLSGVEACPRNVTMPVVEYQRVPGSTFDQLWQLNNTVPLFLALILGPLLNFKSVTFFTKFNSFGTLSAMYLVLFVLVKSIFWGLHVDFDHEDSPYFSPLVSSNLAATSGMLPLSFFIHSIVITLMRHNKDQTKNDRDLSIAYGLVGLTYCLVGVLFYLCFPLAKSCIDDNLLNNFQNRDLMTVIARGFIFFQLLTVFPLIMYMLRIQIFAAMQLNHYPSLFHVILLNITIVGICVSFAVFFPKIGALLRFTGALGGFICVFTLPCLLYIASEIKEDRLTWQTVVVHSIIPLTGFINFVAQFFVND
ncbi:sodium-coupled neutral amino acid transporter 9 homolog [Bemisia tabaci]|uniref:sodium-coupled neutral amino acid transporter 9 homolog n=1 Tax=Bemisia tabaci TaxID=7038 RepID=UPI003B281A61